MSVDLSKIKTEQRNNNSVDIDLLETIDIIDVINQEDLKVAQSVSLCKEEIKNLVDAVVSSFYKDGRLIYMGAGTSGRIGIIDAVECRPTYGVPKEMVQCLMAGGVSAFVEAVEGAEDSLTLGVEDLKRINLNKTDIVIGLAASGRTPYVLSAIEYAKSIKCTTGCVVTTPNSPLEKLVDFPVVCVTGEEVITGSTRMKSGTAQKMICNMISTASMIKMGKVYQNLMIDVLPTNEKLVSRTISILQSATGVSKEEAIELLQKYKTVKKALFSKLTGETNIETIDKYLDKTKGHIRNALRLFEND